MALLSSAKPKDVEEVQPVKEKASCSEREDALFYLSNNGWNASFFPALSKPGKQAHSFDNHQATAWGDLVDCYSVLGNSERNFINERLDHFVMENVLTWVSSPPPWLPCRVPSKVSQCSLHSPANKIWRTSHETTSFCKEPNLILPGSEGGKRRERAHNSLHKRLLAQYVELI